MNKKRRREFIIRNSQTQEVVAKGILYDEGNVQVLWRADIGWTAEQYANITQMFGMMENAYIIEVSY